MQQVPGFDDALRVVFNKRHLNHRRMLEGYGEGGGEEGISDSANKIKPDCPLYPKH